MRTHLLLNSLSEIGINVSIQGDCLRLTGNLNALTDSLKADLQREKLAIMTSLVNPYPNENGLVKCSYCHHYRDRHCTRGHQPGGIYLLRDCRDFRFKCKAHDGFYSRQVTH
jgi:hypothetical protein